MVLEGMEYVSEWRGIVEVTERKFDKFNFRDLFSNINYTVLEYFFYTKDRLMVDRDHICVQ